MIKARVLNRNEVILCNPSIPMVVKYVKRGIVILQGTEGVFIDYVGVVGIVEDTRGYPGLCTYKAETVLRYDDGLPLIQTTLRCQIQNETQRRYGV